MNRDEAVEVLQCDRDAAADVWENVFKRSKFAEFQLEWLRDGAADYGPVVQAFARHRLTAAEPFFKQDRKDVLEEAAKVAEAQFADERGWHHFYKQAGSKIAEAIRSLSEQEEGDDG